MHRLSVNGSLDFVSDALVDGRRFRILCVIDDFSRECLATIIDNSLSGHRVAREIIEDWRTGYNLNRPHTSLDGLTPAEYATGPKTDRNVNRANL